jgi:YVTN family beta-propeller protein
VATFFGSTSQAFFLAVNSRTDTIYLANGDLFVVVVNGRTNTRTARIRVEGEPGGTSVNQRTDTIYASNSSDGDLSVINGRTNKVTAQIPVVEGNPGFGLIAVAVNQRSNDIYATSASTVFAVNGQTNTVSGSVLLNGQGPEGIAVNPSTGTIFTADQQANAVSAFTSTCP